MFCSDSPDLILSNICSILDPTEKWRNTDLLCVQGVLKTKTGAYLFWNPYSRFIHRPTRKSNFQNLNKIKQNPKSITSNSISYPISSNPLFFNYFSHFTPNFQNSIIPKTIQPTRLSFLFISIFTDNQFSRKLSNNRDINSQTISNFLYQNNYTIKNSNTPILRLNCTNSTQISIQTTSMINCIPNNLKSKIILIFFNLLPYIGGT